MQTNTIESEKDSRTNTLITWAKEHPLLTIAVVGLGLWIPVGIGSVAVLTAGLTTVGLISGVGLGVVLDATAVTLQAVLMKDSEPQPSGRRGIFQVIKEEFTSYPLRRT